MRSKVAPSEFLTAFGLLAMPVGAAAKQGFAQERSLQSTSRSRSERLERSDHDQGAQAGHPGADRRGEVESSCAPLDGSAAAGSRQSLGSSARSRSGFKGSPIRRRDAPPARAERHFSAQLQRCASRSSNPVSFRAPSAFAAATSPRSRVKRAPGNVERRFRRVCRKSPRKKHGAALKDFSVGCDSPDCDPVPASAV